MIETLEPGTIDLAKQNRVFEDRALDSLAFVRGCMNIAQSSRERGWRHRHLTESARAGVSARVMDFIFPTEDGRWIDHLSNGFKLERSSISGLAFNRDNFEVALTYVTHLPDRVGTLAPFVVPAAEYVLGRMIPGSVPHKLEQAAA